MLRERGVDKDTLVYYYANSSVQSQICFDTSRQIYLNRLVHCPDGTYESIADETPNFKRYGNCLHIKCTGNLNRVPHCYNFGTYKAWSTDWSNTGIAVTAGVDSLTLEDVAFDGFVTMKPSLTPSFSLANFILELQDLKEMFHLWKRHSGFIQNVAGGYLNYQFGWKLFIQDMEHLISSMLHWKDRLLEYKSKQNRPMVRHYRTKLRDRGELVSHPKSWGTWKSVVNRKQTGVATMRFTYRVPKLDSAYSDLLGLLDIFGLNNLPSIIWEAIPFSFVADWFFRVGDYLALYGGTDWLESVVTIEDFCVSIHTVDEEDQYCGYSSEEPVLAWSKTTDTYERRRCLPRTDQTFGSVLSHRYGTKQILLSAALLLA
jgi:hypothetical protein